MTPSPIRLLSMVAGLLFGSALLVAAPAAAPATPAASGADAVAWQPAANDADIDHAFSQARDAHKPVLLYWGATWCPPCNQLKATLFNRQDFIERSRAFVAVQVDGDLPGAQKLGTRFKVSGYPTLVLFNNDGSELTRLPGEAGAAQVLGLMQQGLAGGRSAKAVLADARAGKPLATNEWRLLAFYSWDTDEQQLLAKAERAPVLAKLASSCPTSEQLVSTRLWLKALIALQADAISDGKPAPQRADPAQLDRLMPLLADASQARAQMDVLSYWPAELVRASSEPGPARTALIARYDQALQRLQSDAGFSRADRLDALAARIELARVGEAADPKADAAKPASNFAFAPALVHDVRDAATRADREITDGYERQAVIPGAADLLSEVGLLDESDALLKANLAKSHAPYYLMSELASNAKQRGDKPGALGWYEQAFQKSEGPATRLQWGASYVNALVELAPDDVPRIERTVAKLLDEAGAQPNAFYERSARAMQRIGKKLQAWNTSAARGEAMQRLRQKLGGICGRIDSQDPQRATCDSAFGQPAGTIASRGA